jgi:hypothetical protein
MGSIGDAGSGLERRGAKFTVESLAKEFRQEWVEEALRESERESVRVRLLPATPSSRSRSGAATARDSPACRESGRSA